MSRARGTAGLLAALVVAVLVGPAQAANGTGLSTTLGIPYGGTVRTFNLYVAAHVPTRRPVPLLLVLHGLYLDPATTEASSGLDRVADEQDVAVAYPSGLNGSWNAGACCGLSSAQHIDDVGFLVRVVQVVARLRPIDPDRVYLAGFSNGGMMALKAACDRPDVFAAAAAVAGTLETACPRYGPVSALLVNGQRDRTVPYAGTSYSGFLDTALTPVPLAARRLAVHDGCVAARTTPGPWLRSTTYRGCADGSDVTLDTLPLGGHRWPTAAEEGVDGEQLVWSFLAAHRRVGRS